MHILSHENTDPALNLALEEYLVTTDDPRFAERDLALLWRNQPAVVVGRNQNTVDEIDRDEVGRRGINVVRRLSGGGAVYHDLGNVNFTIIKRHASRLRNNYSFFTQPLVDTLSDIGVEAHFSGRNDVLVGGAKFSGNAQYHHGDTLLHHGTILYESDLSVLGAVLKPKQRVVDARTRGVSSHASRVINLCDATLTPLNDFCARFEQRLMDEPLDSDCRLTPDVWKSVEELANARYRREDWTWGASPAYDRVTTARFDGGNVTLCLALEEGVATRVGVYGDFFEKKPIAQLEEALTGQTPAAMVQLLARQHLPEACIEGITTEQFLTLLTEGDSVSPTR